MQAGKPRPNFLSACKPNLSASASIEATTIVSADGSISSADSITVDDCTDGRDMADYLRSFPSGHASPSMFLSMYPLIYLLYSRLVRSNVDRGSKESRLVWDARMGLMTCFNAFVFALVCPTSTSTLTFCTQLWHGLRRCIQSFPGYT